MNDLPWLSDDAWAAMSRICRRTSLALDASMIGASFAESCMC